MSDLEKINLSDLDGINPALTRYGREEPAPVLPLREEPDLLSWLETSGRLVSDEDSNDQEISTVEEEEFEDNLCLLILILQLELFFLETSKVMAYKHKYLLLGG